MGIEEMHARARQHVSEEAEKKVRELISGASREQLLAVTALMGAIESYTLRPMDEPMPETDALERIGRAISGEE